MNQLLAASNESTMYELHFKRIIRGGLKISDKNRWKRRTSSLGKNHVVITKKECIWL